MWVTETAKKQQKTYGQQHSCKMVAKAMAQQSGSPSGNNPLLTEQRAHMRTAQYLLQ